MKVKGTAVKHERVELDIRPYELVEYLEEYIYKQMKIENSPYVDREGKLKYDVEFHTSHYSCSTYEFKGTQEQKQAIKLISKLKYLVAEAEKKENEAK
jgi:hypothetical protein